MQSQEWKDRIQVKKGYVGEKIISDFLESKKYVVYLPITDMKHGFDMLAVKDKKIFKIAEVKSYPAMKYYNANGVNYNNYLEYLDIYNTIKIDIILFFVDQIRKKVYYGIFSELIKKKTVYDINAKKDIEYPYHLKKTKTGDKMLFDMNKIHSFLELTNEQIDELKKYSTRNTKYE